MPFVTPQYGPAFPYRVGMLLFDGIQNGQQIYTQPDGIGTPVFPQPPTINPPPNWGTSNWLPAYPFAYVGLFNWGCNHWTNTPEIYTVWDPYSQEQAAFVCCPTCGYVQYIIEPASEWWQEVYMAYQVGIRQPGGGLIPNET
jgi:hypothetical protein